MSLKSVHVSSVLSRYLMTSVVSSQLSANIMKVKP